MGQATSFYSDKFWGGFKIEDLFVLRRIFAHFRVSEVLLKIAGLDFRPHFEYTSGEASVLCIPAFHPGLIAETTCPFGFHGRRVRHEIMESACIYVHVIQAVIVCNCTVCVFFLHFEPHRHRVF